MRINCFLPAVHGRRGNYEALHVAGAAPVLADDDDDGDGYDNGSDNDGVVLRASSDIDVEALKTRLKFVVPDTVSQLEYPDGRTWRLGRPLVWSIGRSGISLVVPSHFVHDSASVPQLYWSFLPPTGRYSRAAIVHDYLYWAQTTTREQADNLLMIAMKESNVDAADLRPIYRAVRLFGERAWEENRRQKTMGMPRLDPTPDKDVDPHLTWPQVRDRLYRSGYRDPPLDDSGAYAHLGNSQHVP